MIILLTILLLLAIFFGFSLNPGYLPNFNFEPLNYLLRVFFHANLQHVLANGMSLFAIKDLNKILTDTQILKIMVSIWIMSSLMLYLIHSINPDFKRITIGFSGVVLGLVIVNDYLTTGELFQVSFNNLLAILPHFFIPGVSFAGHLTGIIAGILASMFLL